MNQYSKKINIQKAELSTISSVVQIMNKATLHLHEKGINQWHYPCDEKIIESDLSKGYVYLIYLDGIPIGTFSIKSTSGLEPSAINPENLYLYRIALLPDFQGKDFGRQITQFACEQARKLNKILYLDCWAGNKKLIEFYTKVGFKSLGIFPEDDYFINIFMYL